MTECSNYDCCTNRSVLERVLGARLVYERGSMARALSFEYLNRQLVWHELSELLLFLLPLLNVQRIKAFVMARLPRIAPPLALGATAGAVLFPSKSCWLASAHLVQICMKSVGRLATPVFTQPPWMIVHGPGSRYGDGTIHATRSLPETWYGACLFTWQCAARCRARHGWQHLRRCAAAAARLPHLRGD